MLGVLFSLMARTTLDIDTPLLEELKAMQAETGKSLGRLVSDLLSRALADHASRTAEAPAMRWNAQPMKARIDVDDKDALEHALDEPDP